MEFKKSHGAFDFVIHNAGATKVRDPKDFYTINQNFTQNLVEALHEADCLNGKFVLMSSLAAMGPGSDETMLPIKESDEPNPVSHYGRSKLFVERYLEGVKDLKYLIFRPTGVYGPREKDYLIFFKTLLNKIEPYIGFKEQKITFIYVKDLCKVVIDSLRSEHENKTYCVTDGYTYSSFDFANISKEILNAKTVKIFVPLFLAKTIAAINSLIAKIFGGSPTLNNEKIKEISRLNWQCETDDLVPGSRDCPSLH